MAKERVHHSTEDILYKITKKIEHFIVKYIKYIVIIISIAIVILAAYFSIDFIITKREEIAQNSFGKVYLVYRELLNEENLPDQELSERLLNLTEDFKIVIQDYPKSMAAAKSTYYIGNILYDETKFNEAIEYYKQGYSINNRTYVSLLCLQKEGSCYEQIGELDKAAQLYEKIQDEYSEKYIAPTVLFSLGQIYEKQNKMEKANVVYLQIATAYQWSSWKEFAEKRQLLIKNFQ